MHSDNQWPVAWNLRFTYWAVMHTSQIMHDKRGCHAHKPRAVGIEDQDGRLRFMLYN